MGRMGTMRPVCNEYELAKVFLAEILLALLLALLLHWSKILLKSCNNFDQGNSCSAKPRVYDDPFNNPLVKIDEGTSTAEMFGKEYRLAPPDVDPDTVRWIPGNHPFAAGSVEVDEETAKKNVYQKDGVPSRVKAEHEALRARLEASNDVTPFSSGLRNMQPNEKSLSDQPSGNLQHSKSEMVNSQHGQPVLEPEKQSSDNSSVSKSLEGQ